MGAGSVRESQAPMHSPVYWALLGLIIARPGYAYELAGRFEHTYGGALELSSMSHTYTALETLSERGLVRRIQHAEHENALHSRRRVYEATELGVSEHAAWLMGQIGEERRRQRALVAQLAASTRNSTRAIELLDEYENTCLAELGQAPSPHEGLRGRSGLVARLVAEETRLALAAKLRWVQYARTQLLEAADSTTSPERHATP
jgi:DNA-binding PadR family transcriptional regulator